MRENIARVKRQGKRKGSEAELQSENYFYASSIDVFRWVTFAAHASPRCLRIAAASGFAGRLCATPTMRVTSMPPRINSIVGTVSTPRVSKVSLSR